MIDKPRTWPFFEHAYVVNLDDRKDRWASMQRQFDRLGIEGVRRFTAVRPPAEVITSEALQPLREFLLRVDGDSERLAAKLRATWGCMLSHLAIIRTARAQGWPYVLILEDDCELESYALPVLQRIATQLNGKAWDMLYLGGTYKKGGDKAYFSSNLERTTRIRLGHAYLVNARIYDRILQECETAGLPIDWYYSEILQPEISCFLAKPILAYQRLFDMSDIEFIERKPEFKTRKAIRRCWGRIRYGAFLRWMPF